MIRKAEQKDLQSIVDIYNASIPSRMATADMVPVTMEERLTWFSHHSDKRPILVFEKDGKVVGWLSFKNFYGRPAYHRTAEVAVYVSVDFRGQGIGDELLGIAVEMALYLDIQNILAFIFSHNIPSRKLFEKYGFTSWGHLPEVAEMDDKLYSVEILGLKLLE